MSRRTIKSVRQRRAFSLGLAGVNGLCFVLYLLDGDHVFAALAGVAVIALLWAVLATTREINRREVQARRPDYVAIGRMEQEIYGKKFAHRKAGS